MYNMLQYWSTWNYLWFAGSKLKLFKITNALKTSLMVTSILGGSLVYIYPRKMFVEYKKDVRIKLNKVQMMISDFLFHQMPFLLTINAVNEENICGAEAVIPFMGWLNYNYYMNTNMDSLYGVKFNKFLVLGLGLFTCIGIGQHSEVIKNLIKNK